MLINSQFIPANRLSNPHLQTLFPYLARKKLQFNGITQSFDLPDGDTLDLVWTEKPCKGTIKSSASQKPIVIIFHGLEGAIESHYAKGMMLAIQQKGWIGLFVHFRSCAKAMNRRANLYHSGETGDAKRLLNWLKFTYPQSPLAAIGFSLGGNMLLKLVAEQGKHSLLNAVVSVSAPLVLQQSANRLNKGFSKLYQMHLLHLLKQKLMLKFKQHDYQQLIRLDLNTVKKFNTIREFDDKVTAPFYGFESAEDYYKQCSSRQFLKEIKTPTLIIQALDDPFMGDDMLPDKSELSSEIQLELSQCGGHVGFIGGSVFNPHYWLEQRIPEYLSQYIPETL